MSLLKYIMLGAAAVYGYKYVTKKRESDGKSLVDDLQEQAPEYMEKAKKFGERVKQDYTQTSELF